MAEQKRIEKGDEVLVIARGVYVRGLVVSADRFRERGQWFYNLEVRSADTGLLHYWKQGADGGRVQLLAKG